MCIYTECETQTLDIEKIFGRHLILYDNFKKENTVPKKLRRDYILRTSYQKGAAETFKQIPGPLCSRFYEFLIPTHV